MKKKRVSLNYKNRKISIDLESCPNFGIGLMFKSRNTNALLFDFKKKTKLSITSLFVFFPFVAVWLDAKNKVLEIRTIKPFRLAISPKKSFNKLIEIPINGNYAKEVALLCPPRR
ncbi:DUF192 domain-containing protein [Candidatus Pacearchaeota archaeon]|nr:DUF192 domain-containing protein [Candidatus Pacearchaeota archaeon]